MSLLQKPKKKKIIKSLRNKFRLVVMNDDTFEVKFSMFLSPLNVYTWGSIIVLVVVFITSILIAFTPVREIIPGYADVQTKQMATYALIRADSLQEKARMELQYAENIRAILQGRDPAAMDSISQTGESISIKDIENKPSKQDSLLRQRIESEDQYNLHFNNDDGATSSISKMFFFTPLKGIVSATFSLKEQHFGVDIIAPENEAIKSTLDGTVTLATWTSETGHIIQVQHENNLISMYKHNSVLFKKVGDKVKAGEAIAIIGESGELSSGPHLHLELWHNGTPVDPQDYIIF
ncbi:M23 family metallopeptidase [bacterium]|nr:M23 family metallopeptidase [bacterium]|tara:strand:- start:241 stop:1119 length:879 start_codon:yes stop_codon:yes gene_type:complete